MRPANPLLFGQRDDRDGQKLRPTGWERWKMTVFRPGRLQPAEKARIMNRKSAPPRPVSPDADNTRKGSHAEKGLVRTGARLDGPRAAAGRGGRGRRQPAPRHRALWPDDVLQLFCPSGHRYLQSGARHAGRCPRLVPDRTGLGGLRPRGRGRPRARRCQLFQNFLPASRPDPRAGTAVLRRRLHHERGLVPLDGQRRPHQPLVGHPALHLQGLRLSLPALDPGRG